MRKKIRLDTGASGSNVARIVREGEQLPLASDHPIEPGDIVSIDSGLKYLGYETDFKRTAYVLKPGETEPPDSIRAAWQTTFNMSDVYIKEMVPGRVGHEVWAAIVGQAAGAWVPIRRSRRRWPCCNRCPSGDRSLRALRWQQTPMTSVHVLPRICPSRTANGCDSRSWKVSLVSVEFHLSTPIPEWDGKTWYSRFEENARQGAQTIEWLIPRQEKLILIQPEGGLKTSH